jgi:hypothetical protein
MLKYYFQSLVSKNRMIPVSKSKKPALYKKLEDHSPYLPLPGRREIFQAVKSPQPGAGRETFLIS